uniref:Putative tail protein n=1 Tax=viral metagenome TaxID=1070528 RepID=A0A6M3IPQ6_9ZZZZ
MMTFKKDPGEKLDYAFDWDDDTQGPYLESGETISASAWVVPSGITEVSASYTDTITKIWLSGGTEGTSYELENTITTSEGRIVVRSFIVVVEER